MAVRKKLELPLDLLPRAAAVLGLIVMSALWTVVAVRAGLLFDGVRIFWWEAAGLAVVTLVLIAVWYSGGQGR